MPTRFASSIDDAPILAARAYADQYGVNIDQFYAKKTDLFSGDYNDLSNKPDLSVYALASSLATVATSGSYNDLSDKPTIPAAQVQSDWNQTNSSAVDYIKNKPTLFSGDYNDLTNKPDLSVYALSSSLAAVATSGDYNDLSNKPTIPAAQVNSDWNAVSGVAQILNKPDLSVYALSSSLATVATSGDYNDLTNKPTIPAAQIQSDWSQTNSSALDYIKNKPDLSVYALASSLASVATSGDYNDLINKPSIPAAQVQSDYAQSDSSAIDYIKNKPDLSVYALSSSLATVATSGDYNDLSNKPSIPTKTSDLNNDSGFITGSDVPANQTQSDWTESDTTDPAYIQNKPTQIGLVAGTNISFVEDNANNTLTINATAAPQQQADWNQSNASAVDYIKNKPDLSVYALVADLPTFVEGQNIHISTSGTNVTISADDTTYTAGTGIDINNNVISVDTDDVMIDYWHGGSNTALASGTNLNANLSATAYRGTNVYVSGGAITLKPGTYAVNAFVKINNNNTTLDDDCYKLSVTGGITNGNPTIAYNFDNSFRHEEVIEVSFLTVNLGSSDAALVLTTDALSVLSGVSVTLTYAQVYCLSGIVGASGSGGGGSAIITLSSTDHSVTITENTVGDVKNFDLSVPTQVQADWSQSNSSALDYIKNKPDLSVYALSANLATVATSGSYNDLSNKPTIPAAPVQSNWNESDSSSLAYIQNKPSLFSGSYNDLTNKPDLSVYALSSSLATVATSGSYTDLSNKPSIPSTLGDITTTAGITDIQKVAALPQSPVSTVLYLIEES